MPLPLLLIPIVVAAASSGISVGALIGAITGSTMGGAGIASAFWYYLYKNTNEINDPEAYKASLRAQSESVKEQIKETKGALQAIEPKLTEVKEAVRDAAAGSVISQEHYDKVVANLEQTRKDLLKVTQKAQDTSDQLNASLASLKEITQKCEEQMQASESHQKEFQELLHSKEQELTKALGDINAMNQTVAGRLKQVTDLETLITSLQSTISEQEQTIVLKTQTIDMLDKKVSRYAQLLQFFQSETKDAPQSREVYVSRATVHH